MKRLLLIMICPLLCMAQWTEDFSSSLENWYGDTALFEIDSTHLLHLNAPAAANSSFLWRNSEYVFNGEWLFYVQMDFNPSASNYALVHLMNDENGYFVKIGGSEDAISLYKRTGETYSKIIAGTEDLLDVDSVKVQVKVLRDSIGNWELWADTNLSNNFIFLGDTFDNTHITSTNFGLQCTYTQTRSDKFFFDNISVAGTSFQDTFALPNYRDIVINELMVDPSPPNDLAEEEYIELHNTSNQTFNLQHLQIGDYSQVYSLPFHLLKPDSFVLLKENIPTLNNNTDSIRLWLHDSVLIDEVNYLDDWHSVTTDGGISLELINPFSSCSNKQNWASSTALAGGTPADINSVFSDVMDAQAPQLSSFYYQNDSLFLRFGEEVNIDSISHGELLGNIVVFNPPLAENQEHQLTLFGVNDCEGNTHHLTLSFIVPASPEKGDVILNEILFNPIEGANDFVEIYNVSDKYIDLQNWFLANLFADTIANLKNLCDSSFIIYPQEVWALCKDAQTLLHYHSSAQEDRIIEMSSLPNYNNDVGSVYLLHQTEVMDEFHYSEHMHFDLLEEVEGVSLERINPQANEWQSAAENVGFATPTLPNSQAQNETIVNDIINTSPSIFSPNNDGENDVLQIKISLGKGQHSGSVHIFNSRGILVKVLKNNILFGSEDVFFWDGITDNGHKAPIGRYIIYLEVINDSGKIVKAKKTCVLGGHL